MNLSRRKWTIASILIIVPIGFYTKFYSGPASMWVNNSLGGVLYVNFWCLILHLFFPSISPLKNAVSVFIITCVLEFLQLWHPEFLETVRSNFLGRTLIGNSFSWLDIIHYLIGSIAAFLIVKHLSKLELIDIN